MSQENVEIVRRALEISREGIRRRDFGAAFDQGVDEGLIAPDLEWGGGRRAAVGVAGLGDVVGREGIVGFMDRWTEDFDDFAVETEEVIDAGNDQVVAITRQHGTGKGSGAPVEMHPGMLFTLQGGRIVRLTIYIESAKALKAAGLSA
jgi:ketosteroid isomerase-like protein